MQPSKNKFYYQNYDYHGLINEFIGRFTYLVTLKSDQPKSIGAL